MKFTRPPISSHRAKPRSAAEISAEALGNLQSFKEQETEYPKDFQRIPFGNAQPLLAATEIEGYHLHWINDWHPSVADRLQRALKAGYRYVTQEEVDSARLLGAGTTDLGGDRVSRTVGTRTDGSPITAYLMKIPLEWWMEHQQPVWDRADQVDNSIRRGAIAGKLEGGYNPKNDAIKISIE